MVPRLRQMKMTPPHRDVAARRGVRTSQYAVLTEQDVAERQLLALESVQIRWMETTRPNKTSCVSDVCNLSWNVPLWWSHILNWKFVSTFDEA